MPEGIQLDKPATGKDKPGKRETQYRDSQTEARSISLYNIALAAIARLIFSDASSNPSGAEEQYLYDIHQGIPQQFPYQGEPLVALLENSLLQPAQEDVAIVALARHYQLHWLETLALILCFAVERDVMTGRVLAYVQSPVAASRPTFGLLENAWSLLLKAHTHSTVSHICVSDILLSGKSIEIGLLETTNLTAPLPEQTVKIPQSVVVALQGGWWPIKGVMFAPQMENVFLPDSIRTQAIQQATVLGITQRRALVVRSTSRSEAIAIANLIAAELGLFSIIIKNSNNYDEPLGILSVISGLLPVFQLSLPLNEAQLLPELAGYDGPLLVLTEPDGMIRSDSYSMINWLLPIPSPDERRHLWSHYLNDTQLAAKLARDHRHSAGRIAELADIARREAELQQRKTQTLEDIHKAAWSNGGNDLTLLADAIPERISDDALILTPNTRADLQGLLHRCRNRESLVDHLGVSLKARYQPGVRGLFIGPSGTGKTMAAAWLATQLSMPLYRIDLASVISKYIGETEKNLANLLSRAERSDVILLFDEADSLFGKRTDIKDSNDRYANTQTNYLLQRIESYQGIVLLTSNNRSRFDSAFTRRLDLIIDFPAPGPQERRTLWYSHLGQDHGISNSHINQLAATLDICGGHIRNVVLSAAVLAKTEQREIVYADIIEGLKIEYKKLAKKLPLELTGYHKFA